LLVAQANRALRGADLAERGVPKALHSEVQALWRAYDYAYHADNTRPRNTGLMSEELAGYLVDHFVIWGDDAAWRRRLLELRRRGCDGVVFILGQGSQVEVLRGLTRRLRDIGELRPLAGSAADVASSR
jgi:5,10-methylenetetrahydromethanopterin reductase